jgi:phosphatidylglycerophosphatase A
LTETEKKPSRIDFWTTLATVFGIGFIPVMPGTFGTLAAAFVYLSLPSAWLTSFPSAYYSLAAIAALFFAGVYITGKAEHKLGHDAGSIILDEFVAYFICVLFLPKSILMAVYTFAVFRVFDIAKPQPVRLSQKLKAGWGVMTDDVIAAVFTNLFMQVLIRLYPRFFVY